MTQRDLDLLAASRYSAPCADVEWRDAISTFFGALGFTLFLGGLSILFLASSPGWVFLGCGAQCMIRSFRLWNMQRKAQS